MEFKELQQTIVRKDTEIQKSKDILVTMEKKNADDEMVWEDHNCQIIYKSEKVTVLTHRVETQTTLIDSLQISNSQKTEIIAE